MLRSISLSNVRSFAGGPWKFELGELTALCGANSAGKSTLIKSLLLLRANSRSVFDPERYGRVLFSDKDFDLGDFRSFASNNDIRKPFSIELEFAGEFPRSAIGSLSKLRRQELKQGGNPSNEYLLKACFTLRHVGVSKSKYPQPDTPHSPGFGILESAKFSLRLLDVETFSLEVCLTEAARKAFPLVFDPQDQVPYVARLSKEFFKLTGGAKVIQPANETADVVEFTPVLHGIFPVSLVGAPATKNKSDPTASPSTHTPSEFTTIALPPLLRGAISDLREFLDQIDYNAPLRAHAKRFYLLNQEYSAGGDASGESIPYLLRDNLERVLAVSLPQSLGKTKSATLKSALNSWIRYLRDGVSTRSRKDEISMSFYRGLIGDIRLHAHRGQAFPLADIGFGFSQLLPILVKGLLLPSQGTLVVEQPELHLHPAIQIRLAEFFASLVANGKSVVIETHSEHLINSLRVVVAEDKTNLLAKKIRILFLSKAPAGGQPQIIDLTLREDGSIPDFPKEFFGEALSLTGRLLRAQKAKRIISQSN